MSCRRSKCTHPSAKTIWQYEYHRDAFEGEKAIDGVSAKKFVQNFGRWVIFDVSGTIRKLTVATAT